MARNGDNTNTNALPSREPREAPIHPVGIWAATTKRRAIGGEGFCDVQNMPQGNGPRKPKKG